VSLLGLDPNDSQGDKAFVNILKKMGCHVSWDQVPVKRVPLELHTSIALEAIGKQTIEFQFEEWLLSISRKGPLKGGEFDLNATPDLLPPLAAVACFAEGDTALVNAAHARTKETDRITVMATELRKLGFKISERSDGLVIHGGRSNAAPGTVNSHGDHRVAMALACAALGCSSPVEITGAECAAISYPGFWEFIKAKLL
jgi:3-phosphoshikimate 1-carboxyvinyltransferase